ncbi:hypothetical protein PCE1_000246 [Barthelona sp. PCE]
MPRATADSYVMFGTDELFIEQDTTDSSKLVIVENNDSEILSPSFSRQMECKANNNYFKRVLTDNTLYYTFKRGNIVKFMMLMDDGWEYGAEIFIDVEYFSKAAGFDGEEWNYCTLACVTPTVYIMSHTRIFTYYRLTLIDVETKDIYSFQKYNHQIYRQPFSSSCSGTLILRDENTIDFYMLDLSNRLITVSDGPIVEEKCIELSDYYTPEYGVSTSLFPFIGIDYMCLMLHRESIVCGLFFIGKGEVLDIAKLVDIVIGLQIVDAVTAQTVCFSKERIHFVIHCLLESTHVIKHCDGCEYHVVKHHIPLHKFILSKTTENGWLSDMDHSSQWSDIITYRARKKPLIFIMDARKYICSIRIESFQYFFNEKLLATSRNCTIALDFSKKIGYIIPNYGDRVSLRNHHCFVDGGILGYKEKYGYFITKLPDFYERRLNTTTKSGYYFPSGTFNSNRCLFVTADFSELLGSSFSVFAVEEYNVPFRFNETFFLSYVDNALAFHHAHGILYKCLLTDTIVTSSFSCQDIHFILVNPYDATIFAIQSESKLFLFKVNVLNRKISIISETTLGQYRKCFMAVWFSHSHLLLQSYDCIRIFNSISCSFRILRLEDVANPELYTYYNIGDSLITAFSCSENKHCIERIEIQFSFDGCDLVSHQTIPLIDFLCNAMVYIER